MRKLLSPGRGSGARGYDGWNGGNGRTPIHPRQMITNRWFSHAGTAWNMIGNGTGNGTGNGVPPLRLYEWGNIMVQSWGNP